VKPLKGRVRGIRRWKSCLVHDRQRAAGP
jgi:hypothetical protein